MGSAAPAIKAAVFTLLGTLYQAPTLVTYGAPGVNQPEEIVGVMGMRMRIELPVMTPNRPREEITELDIVFSVWVPGGEDQQQVATERAFVLAQPFFDYFKTQPNETLGGSCRKAWVSSYDLAETITVDANSGDVTGRTAELTAVLTAHTRI